MTDDTDTMIAKGIGKGLTDLPQNVNLTRLNILWLPEVRINAVLQDSVSSIGHILHPSIFKIITVPTVIQRDLR